MRSYTAELIGNISGHLLPNFIAFHAEIDTGLGCRPFLEQIVDYDDTVLFDFFDSTAIYRQVPR